MRALQARFVNNVSFVVAPNEADHQLIWLARTKKVHVVITTDTDMLAGQCPVVCQPIGGPEFWKGHCAMKLPSGYIHHFENYVKKGQQMLAAEGCVADEDNILYLYLGSNCPTILQVFGVLSGHDYNEDRKETHGFPGIGKSKALQILVKVFKDKSGRLDYDYLYEVITEAMNNTTFSKAEVSRRFLQHMGWLRHAPVFTWDNKEPVRVGTLSNAPVTSAIAKPCISEHVLKISNLPQDYDPEHPTRKIVQDFAIGVFHPGTCTRVVEENVFKPSNEFTEKPAPVPLCYLPRARPSLSIDDSEVTFELLQKEIQFLRHELHNDYEEILGCTYAEMCALTTKQDISDRLKKAGFDTIRKPANLLTAREAKDVLWSRGMQTSCTGKEIKRDQARIQVSELYNLESNADREPTPPDVRDSQCRGGVQRIRTLKDDNTNYLPGCLAEAIKNVDRWVTQRKDLMRELPKITEKQIHNWVTEEAPGGKVEGQRTKPKKIRDAMNRCCNQTKTTALSVGETSFGVLDPGKSRQTDERKFVQMKVQASMVNTYYQIIMCFIIDKNNNIKSIEYSDCPCIAGLGMCLHKSTMLVLLHLYPRSEEQSSTCTLSWWIKPTDGDHVCPFLPVTYMDYRRTEGDDRNPEVYLKVKEKQKKAVNDISGGKATKFYFEGGYQRPSWDKIKAFVEECNHHTENKVPCAFAQLLKHHEAAVLTSDEASAAQRLNEATPSTPEADNRRLTLDNVEQPKKKKLKITHTCCHCSNSDDSTQKIRLPGIGQVEGAKISEKQKNRVAARQKILKQCIGNDAKDKSVQTHYFVCKRHVKPNCLNDKGTWDIQKCTNQSFILYGAEDSFTDIVLNSNTPQERAKTKYLDILSNLEITANLHETRKRNDYHTAVKWVTEHITRLEEKNAQLESDVAAAVEKKNEAIKERYGFLHEYVS